MKIDDMNKTTVAKWCKVQRKGGVNKRRNQDHVQHSYRGPTGTMKTLFKEEGGCVQERDICPDTWVMTENLELRFPRLEKRKG